MKVYTLNDAESKTLLEMASDCIDRGMVESAYEIDKINDVINDSISMYSKNRDRGIEVEIEVRLKVKSE